MKYLVLLAVVGLVIWWLRRARSHDAPTRPQTRTKTPDATPDRPAAPTPMLACAHCGVHLPQAEAVTDGAGRPFCGEAHRLAGPR